jgi:hypothetical protein
MDSRKVGDEFETEIAKLLNCRKTLNSGAYWGDGDLCPVMPHLPIMIEAKVKNDNPVVRSDVRKDLDKLEQQASKLGKDWIYIVKDENNDKLVICDLNLFARLTEHEFHGHDNGKS